MNLKNYDALSRLKTPVLGKPIGYDMKAGDWVSPHGKGETIDFFITFHFHKDEKSFGGKCELSFPHLLDGIQENRPVGKKDHSSFKGPFEAPKDNYINTFLVGEWRYDHKINPSQYENPWKEVININDAEGKSFIFRTRSKVDKDNKLQSACYGEMAWFGFNERGIKFKYLFNPDGTRNLEWDKKTNLFDKKK